MKKPDTSFYGYRNRLQLALLGADIVEVMDEVNLPQEKLSNMNRYALLANWNTDIENAVINKLRERMRPR